MTGSNRRPPACKAGALPAELIPPILVGLGGFEPPTPRLSSVCSNQLSYKPYNREGPGVRSEDLRLAPATSLLTETQTADRLWALNARVFGEGSLLAHLHEHAAVPDL